MRGKSNLVIAFWALKGLSKVLALKVRKGEWVFAILGLSDIIGDCRIGSKLVEQLNKAATLKWRYFSCGIPRSVSILSQRCPLTSIYSLDFMAYTMQETTA